MSFRALPRIQDKPFYLALIFLVVACGGLGTAEGTPTADVEVPIELDLVYVPAGSFYMGSSEEADPLAREDEFPLHRVLLDGYFILRNEVTNFEYQQCVEAGICSSPTIFEDGPSTHYNDPAYAQYPVVGVEWAQAGTFCAWVDSRLPTEAEWEKTARGEFGDLYPWGADDPSCSLSNMAGCFVDPPDTDKIGQYPPGESFYEANDMSGNVWEWTSDWYLEDYYLMSPNVAPLGPEDGELKVVRGGSFENEAVDLRAAARLGLDPDEAYNNVGFRCIPIGDSQGQTAGPDSGVTPPFCDGSYVPFCNDPNNPPGENCDPTTTQQGTGTPGAPGDYDLTGFGCPSNGLVNITIQGDGSSADAVQVTVNGVVYTCVDSTVVPGRWVCTGSPPTMGTIATISVCPDQNVNLNTDLLSIVPAQQNSGLQSIAAPQIIDQLVAYSPPQQAGLVPYQPPNTGSGAPDLQALTTNSVCPDGFIFNPDTGQCETDPNGGCPEGTSLAATNQGCAPDTGQECPEGFSFAAASNTCEANDGNNGCPQGYFYNREISCCSPLPGDNLGCEQGSYRDVATNECVPLDEDGCKPGTSLNRYEGGCVPDRGDGNDGNVGNPQGGCRLTGYVMNEAGQCVPDDEQTTTTLRVISVCDEGQYWDWAVGQCIAIGDGQCPPGYYYDANQRSCRPTDGPGSGCATGYAFNTRLNCCVPTPGNDGSTCFGEQTGSTRLISVSQPSQTNYDYGQGYCDPGEDECPAGFTYDARQQACVPSDDDPIPPTGEGQCPDGYIYDQATNSCVVPEPVLLRVLNTGGGCGEGQYYDRQLGYCVQADCNGCALGFYYESRLNTCVPYPDGDSCPNGTAYNEELQTCLPLTGQTTEAGCWTISQSVPVCQAPTPTDDPRCPDGKSWRESTESCVENYNPQATSQTGVACNTFGSQSACSAAGCQWVCTGPSLYVCNQLPSGNGQTYGCQ